MHPKHATTDLFGVLNNNQTVEPVPGRRLGERTNTDNNRKPVRHTHTIELYTPNPVAGLVIKTSGFAATQEEQKKTNAWLQTNTHTRRKKAITHQTANPFQQHIHRYNESRLTSTLLHHSAHLLLI